VKDGLIEANPGDGPNEVTPAGCSNSALLACCKAQTSDDTPLADQVMGTVSVASETGSQLPIKSVDTVSTTSGIGSAFSKSVGISSVNRGSANGLLVKAESETPIKAVTISAEINSGYQLSIFVILLIGSDAKVQSILNIFVINYLVYSQQKIWLGGKIKDQSPHNLCRDLITKGVDLVMAGFLVMRRTKKI